MKKVAAVAVSIGVILVIAGLVMVGIFGGNALKNLNWQDIFNANSHNLSLANDGLDRSASQLDGLTNIEISTSSYAVYVLPAEQEAVSVKYIAPLDGDAKVTMTFQNGILKIMEKDSLADKSFWGGAFKSNRFIAVYLPRTEPFTKSAMSININSAGIDVKNVALQSIECNATSGRVSVANCKIDETYLSSNTGSVAVDNIVCNNLNVIAGTGSVSVKNTVADKDAVIRVDTGSINCSITADNVNLNSKTGSVKFEARAFNITIKNNTGSIKGTVLGNKSECEINVKHNTGSSNLVNQQVENAAKFLTVESGTGSIRIDFRND